MRTFLFDLDGTLLDSIDLILSSFHHTSRVHRRQELTDADWLEGIGTPLRVQLRKIARSAEELDQMLDTYRHYNLSKHDEMARPYPDVVDVVRQLHAKPAKLGLVTSKLRGGVARGLRLLNLETELSTRVCGDDVQNGKPHPEPLYKALDALDASAEETVFIGDSPHDIHAGNQARVTTIAVAWGPFPREKLEAARPDLWVERPTDLLDL